MQQDAALRLTPTTLVECAAPYEAVVFDQWGVLHNGSMPYRGAVEAMQQLAKQGKTLAMLSNSGKRAAVNAQRTTDMGLPADLFTHVMTSGEAFWRDCAAGRVAPGRLFPIIARPGDFEAWRHGLKLTRADSVLEASAVLLMGLPEGTTGTAEMALLNEARVCGLPLYCTNPDRGSPRADGVVQLSPGALAHAYQDAGGDVTFYGKPHQPVFDALSQALGVPPSKTLMVGDSLEHDIAGGDAAGWATAFVIGGLHADAFVDANPDVATRSLAAAHNAPMPTFLISQLAESGV